jgi:hypothetical protein
MTLVAYADQEFNQKQDEWYVLCIEFRCTSVSMVTC